MLPENIGIAAKGKNPIIGLRKVEPNLVFPILLGFGTDKGQFASGTKAYSNSDILSESPAGIKRGRVMMKGFPVRTFVGEEYEQEKK